MPQSPAHKSLLQWYADHARDLPWRRAGVTAWEVLVSEVMLQQTPVARVLPAYAAWLERWPTPEALARERAGEAVRQWGRLGYPRRALRLHQAAGVIAERHDGRIPDGYDDLRALPGVGDYTAAAVAAFAFGRRVVVLDTNVRRVLSRLVVGRDLPAGSVSRSERAAAEVLLPDDADVAAAWSVAVMELGALVCTARAPACGDCPISRQCAWRAAGAPPAEARGRRQPYTGSDRQCRGRILSVLRAADAAVAEATLAGVWDDVPQRERALASLLDDGLVVPVGAGSFSLP